MRTKNADCQDWIWIFVEGCEFWVDSIAFCLRLCSFSRKYLSIYKCCFDDKVFAFVTTMTVQFKLVVLLCLWIPDTVFVILFFISVVTGLGFFFLGFFSGPENVGTLFLPFPPVLPRPPRHQHQGRRKGKRGIWPPAYMAGTIPTGDILTSSTGIRSGRACPQLENREWQSSWTFVRFGYCSNNFRPAGGFV